MGVVSWEGGRVVCWKGGKGSLGGRIVGQQNWRGWRAVTWQFGKSEGGGGGRGVVRRWQGGRGTRVVTWQGGKGGRFLVLFKSGGHRVSPRFHLFVSDVDQRRKKGAG